MPREAWWGTRDRVSTRLRLEVEMMRATFADTFRLVVPRNDLLYWVGDVEINLAGIPQRLHTLKSSTLKITPTVRRKRTCAAERLQREAPVRRRAVVPVQPEGRGHLRVEPQHVDGGHGRGLGDSMALRVLHLARDERLAGC